MFRSLLLAWLGILSIASAAVAQDWARAMFETTSHDFGSVARGAKAEYSFVVTNNLAADVHIASVRSSCGCTTPSIEKAWLKTYEKGAILAHLNSGSYLGRRGATVTVTIDQPAYAEVQLQIKARVHEDVLVEPASMEFGSVEQGSTTENRLRIYRANMPNWQIQGVRVADANLSAQVVELARQGSQVWYELRVRLTDKASPGYIREQALLTTNDPWVPQIPILIEGQIQPEVILSPSSLFLGVVRPGEKVTKQLIVRAKKPFRITAITGDAASFEFPAPSSEAKMLHLVPVTFVAGAEWGKVVRTIRVQTDLNKAAAEASTYAVVGTEQ